MAFLGLVRSPNHVVRCIVVALMIKLAFEPNVLEVVLHWLVDMLSNRLDRVVILVILLS
jgi:hypothetical protein